jgi:hypothetical protein
MPANVDGVAKRKPDIIRTHARHPSKCSSNDLLPSLLEKKRKRRFRKLKCEVKKHVAFMAKVANEMTCHAQLRRQACHEIPMHTYNARKYADALG